MKKLILTFALAFAVSQAVEAQLVYSNTVGMVKLTVGANSLTFVSYPFENSEMNLNSIIGDQLTGAGNSGLSDKVIIWNSDAAQYESYWKVEGTGTTFDGKWYKDDGQFPPADTSVPISTGTGFWIQSRSADAQELVIRGKVPAHPVLVNIPVGLAQIGIPYPLEMDVNSPSFDINAIAKGAENSGSSDRLIFWDKDTQSYVALWLVDHTGNAAYDGYWHYDDGVFPPARASFVIKPGTGFWFQRREVTATSWTPDIVQAAEENEFSVDWTTDAASTPIGVEVDFGPVTSSGPFAVWHHTTGDLAATPGLPGDWTPVAWMRDRPTEQVWETEYAIAANPNPAFVRATLGIVDSDSDGLDDGFELWFFGDLAETSTGDYDKDGFTNAQEYDYNTSPGVADRGAKGRKVGDELLLSPNPDWKNHPDVESEESLAEFEASEPMGLLEASMPPTVTISEITSTSVTLDWNQISGATATRVYLAAEPSSTPGAALPDQMLIATLSGTATSYQITDLAPDINAFIRVEVDNDGGTGGSNVYAHTVGGPRATLDNDVREIHTYGPDILQIVIADIQYDTALTGNDWETWQFDEWTVTRSDSSEIEVLQVHRQTIPVGAPDYSSNHFIEIDHKIYLQLAENIGSRDVLTINGPQNTTIVVPFSDQYMESTLIQVNQVGYNPRATERWAYVSGWMGDGGGVDLDDLPATAKVLIEPADPLTPRSVVLDNLDITVRREFDYEAGAPVYQVDLSMLPAAEGVTYRVYVPGVGVSWQTAVSEEAAFKAYWTVMRALLHNRWGVELDSTTTEWVRGADHTTVSLRNTEAYTQTWFDPSTPVTNDLTLIGGYHDAGDYDQRPWHTVVAQDLMSAYEQDPGKLSDNQLNLTPAERNNGIPDLLDEAMWGIMGWECLQDAGSGGVHAGAESYAHPGPEDGFADEDTMPYWTWAIDANTTARVSGLFAQMSRLIAPFDSTRSAELEDRAIDAYNYAVANSAEDAQLIYAASELYRLTGSSAYKTKFETIWGGSVSLASSRVAPISGSTFIAPDWVQGYAAASGASSTIVNEITANLDSSAAEILNQIEEDHAFRQPRGDQTVLTWGNSTALGRYTDILGSRERLGGLDAATEQAFFNAYSQAADFVFGCNQLGIALYTGLGSRHIEEALHLDSLVWLVQEDPMPMIPGIAVYGMSSGMPNPWWGQTPASSIYPYKGLYPEGMRFADIRLFVENTEFTIWETMSIQAKMFAALLGDNMSPPGSYLPGGADHKNPLLSGVMDFNHAPLVNAGGDQTLTYSNNVATLDATVMDDGYTASVTTVWSKISGPGTVTFGDANAADTTATFSALGTYVLRLSADDGTDSAYQEITVVYENQAPSVSVSDDDIAITSPSTSVSLDGTVTDDGLPASPGQVSTTWTAMEDAYASDFTSDQSGNFYEYCQLGQLGTNNPASTISRVIWTDNDLQSGESSKGWYEGEGAYLVSKYGSIAPAVLSTSTFSDVEVGLQYRYVTEDRLVNPFDYRVVLAARQDTADDGDSNTYPVYRLEYDGVALRIVENRSYDNTATLASVDVAVLDSADEFRLTFSTITSGGDVHLTGRLYEDNGAGMQMLAEVKVVDNDGSEASSGYVGMGAASKTAHQGGIRISEFYVSEPTTGVTFGNASAVDTTATLPGVGSYRLWLEATDGSLVAGAPVTVRVYSNGANAAPTADAGNDQYIFLALKDTVNLDGTVSDDGLPNPPASVTTTWTRVSGPGTVTFGDANAVDTTASFSTTGTYVLRLTASDGTLQDTDDVTIDVRAIVTNQAPTVDAGPNVVVDISGYANLDGTVSDDGLPNPPAAVTTAWSLVSGPGTVTFGDANAVDTTASFSTIGTYVLRLTAHDGQRPGQDGVSIAALAEPGNGNYSTDFATDVSGDFVHADIGSFGSPAGSHVQTDWTGGSLSVLARYGNIFTQLLAVSDDGDGIDDNNNGWYTNHVEGRIDWVYASGSDSSNVQTVIALRQALANDSNNNYPVYYTRITGDTLELRKRTGYSTEVLLNSVSLSTLSGTSTFRLQLSATDGTAGVTLTAKVFDESTLVGSVTAVDDGSILGTSMTGGYVAFGLGASTGSSTYRGGDIVGFYVGPPSASGNNAPVAVNDSGYSTNEDTQLVVSTGGVLDNDTDADSDPLTAIKVTDPSNGSVTLNSNGTFTYTPDTGWNGLDSFTYKANDGTDDSNTATVTITVNPVSQGGSDYTTDFSSDMSADFQHAQIGRIGSDAGAHVTADWDAGYLDIDTRYATVYTTALAVSDDGDGTSDNDDGYYTGDVEAQLQWQYANGDSSTVRTLVSVRQNANSGTNTYPVYYAMVSDDVLTLYKRTGYSTETSLDSDSFSTVGGANTYTLSLKAEDSGGNVILTATLLQDETEIASASATDTSSVIAAGYIAFGMGCGPANEGTFRGGNVIGFTVNPSAAVNNAPVAVNDSGYSTNEDTQLVVSTGGVLDNDTDADSDPLTAIKVTDPSNGSVTLNSNGTFTYTPDANWNGSDSFTYRANDGTEDSNTATVSITVNAVSDYTTDFSSDMSADFQHAQIGRIGSDAGAHVTADWDAGYLDTDTRYATVYTAVLAVSDDGDGTSDNDDGYYTGDVEAQLQWQYANGDSSTVRTLVSVRQNANSGTNTYPVYYAMVSDDVLTLYKRTGYSTETSLDSDSFSTVGGANTYTLSLKAEDSGGNVILTATLLQDETEIASASATDTSSVIAAGYIAFGMGCGPANEGTFRGGNVIGFTANP